MAYPSSTRPSRGTSRKIAATATNESWKPASKSVYGFQASSATAPSNRKCQRSTMRALSQASDASAPAIPARTTDGCGPTASTYAPMLASAPSSPTRRDTPSNQLSESAPAATRATFCPETASSECILDIMTDVDGYVRVSRVAGREGESFISPSLQREQID